MQAIYRPNVFIKINNKSHVLHNQALTLIESYFYYQRYNYDFLFYSSMIYLLCTGSHHKQ